MNAMTKHFSPATVADVKVAGPDMLVPNEEAQKRVGRDSCKKPQKQT